MTTLRSLIFFVSFLFPAALIISNAHQPQGDRKLVGLSNSAQTSEASTARDHRTKKMIKLLDEGSTDGGQNCRTEDVIALIEEGVDANEESSLQHSSGNTPLFTAVCFGWTKIVNALIKGRADIDRGLSLGGTTPFHAALLQENAEMANVLINAGVDVQKESIGDKTPFVDYLSGRQNRAFSKEMAKLVVIWGPPLNDSQRQLPVEGNKTLGDVEREVKNRTADAINTDKNSLIKDVKGVLAESVQRP